tara:strand:+ start:4675 stop:5682 length:1008 start_codon:yes stop_codon:yes gene_type:complete
MQLEDTPTSEEKEDVSLVSSTEGDEGVEPSSMIDAILQAEPASSSDEDPQEQSEDVAPAGETPEDAEKLGSGEEQPVEVSEEETQELPEELTDDELKHMNARTKRRIDKLLTQRAEARQEADKGRPIVEFMEKNDIPQEDADVILGLAAQLRQGDFAGFLRSVEPYVDLAKQYTGAKLPADLEKQVRQGFVSPDVAKELAQRRGDEQRYQQNAQRADARRQTEVRELRGQTIRNTINTWEASTKASDPDWDIKQDQVRRNAQALMQEFGAPKTPEEALQCVKVAYEETNKQVGKFRPTLKPTQKVPSGSNQPSTTPRAEPSSFLDAVKQAAGSPN